MQQQAKESRINSQKSTRQKNLGQNIDSSYARYDDMNQGLAMEEKLNEKFPKISLQAKPLRTYLDQTVTKTLVQAMTALDKERPNDPVEFLAYYILSSKKNEQ